MKAMHMYWLECVRNSDQQKPINHANKKKILAAILSLKNNMSNMYSFKLMTRSHRRSQELQQKKKA